MATIKNYTITEPEYYFSGVYLTEYSNDKDGTIAGYSAMCMDILNNLNTELKTADEIDNYTEFIKNIFTAQIIKEKISNICKTGNIEKKIGLEIKNLNSGVQQLK